MLSVLNIHTDTTTTNNNRDRQEPWEMMDMSMALIMVIISQVDAYPKLDELYTLNMCCLYMSIMPQ